MDSHWEDMCFVCGDGGELMCCSFCSHVAHVQCVNLMCIPSGDWDCGECRFQKFRVLELFKGTGSISNYCARYPNKFHPVVSIDIDLACNATETCDVRKWNYGKYNHNYFDIIWASPPCTEYSRLKTNGVRNLVEANSIVKSALEIIDYFRPSAWFIENPATGLLPDQDFMKGIPFFDIDYCKYSNFGYRKRTRIWTNLRGFSPQICNKDCGYVVGNRHINTFGGETNCSVETKMRIPDMLLHKLFWLVTE